MKEDSIRKLYAELECKSDLEELPYKRIQDDSLSEKERIVLQKEWWILSDYAILCDNVHNQEEIVTYAKERVASTSNIFLLARYNHTLYNLTKNGVFCKNAIDNYILIFNQYAVQTDEEIGYDTYLVLNWIVMLSKRIRRDLSDVESLALRYLKSDDIIDSTKRWILASIKENYKKWKIKGLEFVPELCIQIYSHTNDYGECKAVLDVGGFFASRFKKELLQIIYEKMGDNEEKNIHKYDGRMENMIIPHYNQDTYQKMMRYYQMSGNSEKLRYAATRYNENKVGMHFVKFEEKRELPKAFADALTNLFKTAENSSPEQLLYFLANHIAPFMPSHSILEEKWENFKKKKPSYMEFLSAVRSDINNNLTHVTHEEIWKFQYLNICFSNSIRWLIHIISSAVEKKQLSYAIVRSILIHYTNFGDELEVFRNEERFTYRLFDKVDRSLKDFFIQYKKEMYGNRLDWRNCINTLTVQFEGILRDSIRLYNGETSKVVGLNKENVAEMLLDDLLRTEACKNLFSDEDRDLFYYTFTPKGLNIRNNVAHGFYLPHDYTSFKAILIFLCVLRLIKFKKHNNSFIKL